MPEQSIELDCPPGNPRPGDLIEGVVEGLDLPPAEVVSMFFGNWKWDYSHVAADKWLAAKPILAERIKALYSRGLIRYGSW